MSNRYFTFLVVPEKTSRVRSMTFPSWIIKYAAIGFALTVVLVGMMFYNYWYVMSQIGENKQLKLENRRLRQQVQIFQSKVNALESTVDRIKSFSTRLKVILNVENKSPDLNAKLPNANSIASTDSPPSTTLTPSTIPETLARATQSDFDLEGLTLLKDSQILEEKITKIHSNASGTEQTLQEQYELLYDKKSFLAALPTRKPAPGYFTSGFGVRTSPFGDRIKMHEGVDIANRPGTLIRAPADGEVTFAALKPGYGLTLIIRHGYGIETWYGHLRKLLVLSGDKVKRGGKVALLGNSGRSTGPHVHYEIRVHGFPVDPLSYIFEDSSS